MDQLSEAKQAISSKWLVLELDECHDEDEVLYRIGGRFAQVSDGQVHLFRAEWWCREPGNANFGFVGKWNVDPEAGFSLNAVEIHALSELNLREPPTPLDTAKGEMQKALAHRIIDETAEIDTQLVKQVKVSKFGIGDHVKHVSKPIDLPAYHNMHGVVMAPKSPYKEWGERMIGDDRVLVQWACDPKPCGCPDVAHCGPTWVLKDDIQLVFRDRPPEHQPHPGPSSSQFESPSILRWWEKP